jgi:hypothetical protein
MMAQLHKQFTDHQVAERLKKYVHKDIERKYIQAILGIGKTRFFALVRSYRQHPKTFSLRYQRKTSPRLTPEIERLMTRELQLEKKLIQDRTIPLHSYNYSYLKDQLANTYHQKVSLTTIIKRAKQQGYYLRKPERKAHDREVLTHYTGELIQHDASYHQWSPYAQEKWYLISSLDDFSRFISTPGS